MYHCSLFNECDFSLGCEENLRKTENLTIFYNYWMNMVENNLINGLSKMCMNKEKKFRSGLMHVTHGVL